MRAGGWGTMQAKIGFIALGVIGASVQFAPDTAQAQTVLPGITIQGAGGAAATESGGDQGQTSGGNPSTAIDGYVAGNSSTGTKTNTPLREIPQSVSVVTRDQIEDRGAETLNEAIGYSAGVAISPYGVDTRYDQFIIRGFEQNTTGVYRDGLRLPTFSFTGFRIEPYGVDHIDIMRGPTSTLYGLNNPGGLVNVVSKMPTEQAFGEVWVSYGTHDDKAAGFDVGGLSDNGKVLYRVTGLVRDTDTQVDFVENDRVYIAPAITFKPSDATTFTILANYQKDKTGDTFQLLPAEGVLNGTLPRGTFLGEPDFSHLKGEQWSIGYQFEHKFDPAWTVRQNLRYDHATTDYQTIYGAGNFGSPEALLRFAQDADESFSQFQVDNSIQHDSRFDRIENTVLVGVDYSHFSGKSSIGFGGVGNATDPSSPTLTFNPFSPVYGQYFFVDLHPSNLLNPVDTLPLTVLQDRTQEQVGLYVQDQIKFDKKWILTLNGRYDWVSTEADNWNRNFGATEIDETDRAFTGRAGISYLFDNGLTPYFSYSTSFLPVAGLGLAVDDGALAPEEGEQFELGVKYQPKGFKSYVTAALFDLTKENVTQQVSIGGLPRFQQLGEVNVKGIELEAVLDFDNGWKVLGSYAYWHAEITDDEANIGNRPERIPEHIAALWVDYTFRTGGLQGLGLGAGLRYVGQRFGDNANTIDTPEYTLVDAGIRYQWEQWHLSLNVSNLLDEDYAGTCGEVASPDGVIPGYTYCSYGEGRSASVKLGYRW